MRYVISFLVFVCLAGVVSAEVLMDFDFVDYADLAALEAAGWTFDGDDGDVTLINRDGRKALKTDGEPGGTMKPLAQYTWSGAAEVGYMSYCYENSNCYANGTLSLFASDGTELLECRATADTKLYIGDSGLISIQDNNNKPVTVEVMWDAVSGDVAYIVTESDGTVQTGTATLAAAGVPDRIEISQNTNTNGCREVYYYEIVAESAAATVTLTEGATIVAEEGETTDTFDVALAEAPTSNVTVTLSIADPNDVKFVVGGSAQDSQELTFTAGNWDQGQTVTVKAVDDSLVEGEETTTVMFDLGGDDPNQAGGFVWPVEITVVDNDQGSVLIEAGDGVLVNEEGPTSDIYTVMLSDMPSGTIELDMTADAEQIVVQPAYVVLDSSNWSSGVEVTVTAVDDDGSVAENDSYETTISHVVTTADPIFVGATADDVIVTVLNNDCDGPYNTYDRTGPDGVRDCIVDLYDFAGMASAWLECSRDNGLPCN